jgi:hypothetical protein
MVRTGKENVLIRISAVLSKVSTELVWTLFHLFYNTSRPVFAIIVRHESEKKNLNASHSEPQFNIA